MFRQLFGFIACGISYFYEQWSLLTSSANCRVAQCPSMWNLVAEYMTSVDDTMPRSMPSSNSNHKEVRAHLSVHTQPVGIALELGIP